VQFQFSQSQVRNTSHRGLFLTRNAFLFSSATVTAGGNGAKETVEMKEPEVPASPPSGRGRDPYRGVVLVLLVAGLVGTAAAIVAGVMTSNAVLFELAITLGLATELLTGVAHAVVCGYEISGRSALSG
jgi:hypothetical protein